MGSTPHRQACDSGLVPRGTVSSRKRAGADPQVALGAGRMDEVRPLRVRAARWYSLRVRRSGVPPVAGQVDGRLSGEPPHMSKTNSFFGPPPFLCASTLGRTRERRNGLTGGRTKALNTTGGGWVSPMTAEVKALPGEGISCWCHDERPDQPFTPEETTPSTNCFWRTTYRISGTRKVTVAPAITRP